MSFGDLTLVGMLKTKMRWHQARQQVLADNVANADTPRFQPHDLTPLRFDAPVRGARAMQVSAVRTHKAHIATNGPGNPEFNTRRGVGWETTPAGNSVVLEEQMMKVSANQFDFQLATTLYAKSVGLLKMALGRNGGR